MHERRRHPRYAMVIRVDVRLPHTDDWVPPFKGNTVDISREGLAVALYEGDDKMRLIRSLVTEDQSVNLALELPLTGETIRGTGQVKWLDIGPIAAPLRFLRAGIFLRYMNDDDRAKWGHFVEDTARMVRDRAARA